MKFRFDRVMTPDVILFVESFGRYRRHGMLPEDGVWDDQSATWTAAATWLERRMAWNDEDREKRKKRSKSKDD